MTLIMMAHSIWLSIWLLFLLFCLLSSPEFVAYYHLDVQNVFMHEHQEEEVYIEQPRSYEDVPKYGYFCRLDKSIYVLKLASRA
jgi:hypothetical protein